MENWGSYEGRVPTCPLLMKNLMQPLKMKLYFTVEGFNMSNFEQQQQQQQ